MSDTGSSARILLVEDEPIIALAETRVFSSVGYSTTTALNGEDAVVRVKAQDFDIVLMDIDLGSGIDGGEAARLIHEAGGPPVVFLTSHTEESAISKTHNSRGYGFIMKGAATRVLLASVRMALELSSALRSLEESDARWASFARNAADYLVSIGRDGRILYSNRPLGWKGELVPGAAFSSFAVPEERQALDAAIERSFAERLFVRQFLLTEEPDGESRAYEVLFGPAGAPDKPEYLTALLRAVPEPGAASPKRAPTFAEREAGLLATISAFDFSPVRGLLEGFYSTTRMQASIVGADDRFLAATPFARACALFHRASPATQAVCDAAGRAAMVATPEAGGPGYVEHKCANGLRDFAIPLVVEGMRWGTLFAGQFLYDDESPSDEELRAKAAANGWVAADYIAAVREIPLIPRSHMAGILAFFSSLAQVLSSMLASAYASRERSGS